ncbi:hypothetical protein [Streptomyces sp. BH055]|uniref:hypothetical protein n=1 Tax=unclassified Streptomyces TaxID=2593676 RepID=UPI003BB49EF1
MRPHVQQALDAWHMSWGAQQHAAQEAFTAAFPALDTAVDRCQCFGPTLRWDKPGEGAGKACLDDHGRATIEFEGVSKAALGRAMSEVWGVGWFDEGPGGFADADPGNYGWEDEQTYAEYYIDVRDDGLADFTIGYVKVDDIVVVLDELEQALAAERAAA